MNRLLPYFQTASAIKTLAALALVFLSSTGTRAELVFNQTQTGAQLAANPNVTFPTDQPTLDDDSLDFINTADGQVLLRWSLLPAAPRAALEITVTVDYDPLTNDNDPLFGVTAGSRFLGLQRANNASGSAAVIAGSVTETTASLGVGDTIAANGLGGVEPFTFDLSSELLAVTRYEEGTFNTTGTFTHSNAQFDPMQAIAFVLASGGVSENEGYRINSVSVAITAIPEPSSICCLSIALVVCLLHGMTAIKRRRAT
jgi:hypothetical protein